MSHRACPRRAFRRPAARPATISAARPARRASAGCPRSWFRASRFSRSAADRGRVVEADDPSAAIEDASVAFGDLPVQGEQFRIHVDLRPRLVLEMMEAIFAAHQGRAVLAFELLQTG